jgi:rifampin ADP-ribosyltransferase
VKDAKGHGSDPRGSHASGVDQVGHAPLTAQHDDIVARPTDPFIAKMFKGSLRGERYPNEINPEERFYHGSNQKLASGALIEPGHPGNFVRSMKHVYMTTQPEGTPEYKGARGYGQHVYEVRPTGPFGHRSDAKGIEWASEFPLRVVREVTK